MNRNRAFRAPIISLVYLSFFAYAILGIWVVSENILYSDNSHQPASISGGDLVNKVRPYKKESVSNINISAESAISVWTDFSGSSEILYNKGENNKLPIASITKLITALVILDNYDLSQKITITKEAESLEVKPFRILQAGKSFSASQLFDLMLIESNTTAAYSLSNLIGEKEFVELMNKKAKEIGLEETVFENPFGRGPVNFSTVKDVSKIIEYVFKNKPQILEITTQKNLPLYDYEGYFQRNIENLDELLNDGEIGSRIIGGKTGETEYAGECLSLVVRDTLSQKYLITIVLNSKNRFIDTKNIIKWVDENYIFPKLH